MRRFQIILYATRAVADEVDTLKQALGIARNNAAALHAVVFSPTLSKAIAEYQGRLRERAGRPHQSVHCRCAGGAQYQPGDLPVSVHVECGDMPALRIVRRVLRNAHDLLIKHAEPTDRRAGFRALDMQLLRQCPCPVWLGRPIRRSRVDLRVAVAIHAQSTEPSGRDLALQLLRLSRGSSPVRAD